MSRHRAKASAGVFISSLDVKNVSTQSAYNLAEGRYTKESSAQQYTTPLFPEKYEERRGVSFPDIFVVLRPRFEPKHLVSFLCETGICRFPGVCYDPFIVFREALPDNNNMFGAKKTDIHDDFRN